MGCCCSSDKPKWKREVVPDHKFDNIDLDAFYKPSIKYRITRLGVYFLSLKSFAVYVADLWTAVSLLVIGQTTTTPAIPTEISKWLFFACIVFSFLVLLWDIFKARKILKSRDIAYAYTSVIVNRYLSMKDYRYYCLFKSINANSKGIESYAFFVYFQLKDWKRLLIAEAPRQVINIVTLEALVPDWLRIRNGTIMFDNDALGSNTLQQLLTLTMAFSVLVFAVSFILVCAALVLYIPLLCHIQGNLKEYCCHKVDKRIAFIVKKQKNRRSGLTRRQEESEAFLERSPNYRGPMMTASPALSEYSYLPALNSSQNSPYIQRVATPVMYTERRTPRKIKESEQYLLANTDDYEYLDESGPRSLYRHQKSAISYTPSYQHSPYPQFSLRNYGYTPINTPQIPSSTWVDEKHYQTRNNR